MPTDRRVATGLALLLLSCGPEPAPPPVEVEELCGSEGPHRLLALAPGEIVGSVTRVGDRLIYVAGPGLDEDPIGLPVPAEPTIYSTDLCGDDRVVVAEDMIPDRLYRRWPDLLFGCSKKYSGDLYLLDPLGVAEPRVVLPDGCGAGEYNEHGLYEFEPTDEADVHRLVLFPYADAPTPAFGEPIILLDRIAPFPFHHTVAFLTDEILALDPEGTLLRVSLPGGATTIEQGAVHAVDTSSDGRYLVWQDAQSLDGDTDDPAGDIFLRDRQTGTDTLLAHGPLHGARFGADLVHLELGPDVGERFVSLPSLTTTDVPAGWHAQLQVADGRWIVSSHEVGWSAPFALVDPVTGEMTHLTDMLGPTSIGAEYLQILAGAESGSLISTGELWRVPYDGSEPELLARRASTGFRWTWPAGPTLTVVDPFTAGFGRLIVVDHDTLAESVVDERVFAFPIAGRVLGDDTLIYHVDDGDRSGVWAVKLPKPD